MSSLSGSTFPAHKSTPSSAVIINLTVMYVIILKSPKLMIILLNYYNNTWEIYGIM
jgi:hypothetical protein